MRHRNTDRAIVRHRSSATQAPGSTLVMTVALACLIVTSVFAQPSSYVIGSPDVLSITIWNQEDLTGRYIVEIDGTFTFPLVGRVQAAGLTLRDLEEALKATRQEAA